MGSTPKQQKPVVYMLCGLTGSGKTTYAYELEARGAERLSIDEVVFAHHGRHGVDYPGHDYPAHELAAKTELEKQLLELLAAGRSVVLDYGFWSRSDRDSYKELIEHHGGDWRLLYFKMDTKELLQRLAERNKRSDANALTVTEEMFLGDFVHRFEEPSGEGEEIVAAP